MATGPVGGGAAVASDGWSGRHLAHEGFFFADTAQVVDRCRPFVEEGLDLGQPVLVVASAPTRAALTESLGPAASRSLAVDAPAETWWRGPHATMAAYVAAMQPLLQQGSPWRLVAEPVWLAAPRGRYWSRFEAVANVALADYPYYSLCLHDHRRLPPEVTAEACRTHPRVRDATDPTVSSGWRGATDFLGRVEPEVIAPPPTASPAEHVSLSTVREQVRGQATAAGLSAARVTDLVLAADELAANALVHVDRVSVTCWVQDRSLVVQVADQGPGFDDPLGGYVVPSPQQTRRRGLWLARALTDDLAVRSGSDGTVVQASMALATG